MIVEFESSFNKALEKLNDNALKLKIWTTIQTVEDAQKLSEIKNLKKMKGYKTFYRIKLGDYRIGFECVNNTINFITIAHRKDIYRIFP
ncbi:type II toxin-antitoxin system RelE family toxin [Nubsella zeaxanthinifaciens]|uniref:type II toxin-antitoxin system RelE family toxin n=1 Tax=Nubsella zeaxanthinifaciens TaxID=392412 RepID=UPI000DE4DEE2|nr:type II toxin-antitoxin system RelE/ParE family toxin [Nubsella zeaxanthinifaciens]